MVLRIALFVALFVVQLGQCDDSMGFIFPPNATEAYDDTTIANISVHFNDNMTLEYQLPNTEGQLAVSQTCYASVKALESESGSTYSDTATYNNTGLLHWNVGNGDSGNYTGINICRLSISNYTLSSCQWGPWGILNWNQTVDSLLYSQLFNISAAKNGTKPKLLTNTQSSKSTSRATATAGTVTCPPSGIPASAIYTPVPVVEHIPPMVGNISFDS